MAIERGNVCRRHVHGLLVGNELNISLDLVSRQSGVRRAGVAWELRNSRRASWRPARAATTCREVDAMRCDRVLVEGAWAEVAMGGLWWLVGGWLVGWSVNARALI